MKVLLSIKPEYADKIFCGEKKYEFRRAIFKRKGVNRVVVYASAPVGRVIGEFEIESIISDDLHSLWENTKMFAGISMDYFHDYFCGKETGYAIKIKNYIKYEESYDIKSKYGICPPQSFAYLGATEN
ncbi:MAG: ASCH domain-containing protein [Candidatus Margulisiibacteriota bacterium]